MAVQIGVELELEVSVMLMSVIVVVKGDSAETLAKGSLTVVVVWEG